MHSIFKCFVRMASQSDESYQNKPSQKFDKQQLIFNLRIRIGRISLESLHNENLENCVKNWFNSKKQCLCQQKYFFWNRISVSFETDFQFLLKSTFSFFQNLFLKCFYSPLFTLKSAFNAGTFLCMTCHKCIIWTFSDPRPA